MESAPTASMWHKWVSHSPVGCWATTRAIADGFRACRLVAQGNGCDGVHALSVRQACSALARHATMFWRSITMSGERALAYSTALTASHAR